MMQDCEALGIEESVLPNSEGSAEAGLRQVILGHHTVDFWMSICVNNTLIIEPNPSGGTTYQVHAATCSQPADATVNVLMLMLRLKAG